MKKADEMSLVYDSWANTYDVNPNVTLRVLQKNEESFYRKVFELINSQKKSALNVLDIGAGTGRCIPFLLLEKVQLTCVDISENMLCVAKSKFPNKDIRFIKSNYLELPNEVKYDYLNSSLNLMHFKNLDEFFLKSLELSSSSAYLGISCSSEEALARGLRPHYNEQEIEYYIHSHHDIKKSAEKHGFKEVLFDKNFLNQSDILSQKHEKYLGIPFIFSWIFQAPSVIRVLK